MSQESTLDTGNTRLARASCISLICGTLGSCRHIDFTVFAALYIKRRLRPKRYKIRASITELDHEAHERVRNARKAFVAFVFFRAISDPNDSPGSHPRLARALCISLSVVLFHRQAHPSIHSAPIETPESSCRDSQTEPTHFIINCVVVCRESLTIRVRKV